MPGSPSANLICAISCPPGSVCPTQIFDWIEDYTVIPRLVYGKVSEQLRPRPWAHSGFLYSAATGSPGREMYRHNYLLMAGEANPPQARGTSPTLGGSNEVMVPYGLRKNSELGRSGL